MEEDALEYEQLTNLVTGEIDRQLKDRTDVLDTMKTQMAQVLKEFEDLTWSVNAKRSWMKSLGKARENRPAPPRNAAVKSSNAPSPPKLPKLSGLKARNKLQQQLNKSVSGTLPPGDSNAPESRSPKAKTVFDKKLPRVANIEKRPDGLQSILATQQKQIMYERALVRYPQCRGNLFAPSLYDNVDCMANETAMAANNTLQPQPVPRTSLELEFVYGFRNGPPVTLASQTNTSSSNCSIAGNILYLATGEILWFTAALVVLYTKSSNTQRYFREHTNEITAVGLHPNRRIVASGQAGRQTFVLVWDANDEQLGGRFACLKGHTVAVRSISFSHDGRLVASLGGDMYNTICIHDWREQVQLVTARGHSFRVHAIAFNPYQAYGRPEVKRAKRPGQALQDDEVCYTLVSCGVRHIRFWTLTKTDYVPRSTEEQADSAFYGCAFGSPTRLRPPTPHEKMWKLEGNVPSFQGRFEVQDFTSLAFVDDSPPIYMHDEERKELVATNANDRSLGRIIAGTAKGDLCVFWQPRKSPDVEDSGTDGAAKEDFDKTEPAKWWEIPDEYSDADINGLVLEKFIWEPSARLVEMVPHDQATGNRFKISKSAQIEIDSIHKRLTLKPNSESLHTRLSELKYNGPLGHQGGVSQIAYSKKNNVLISCGLDGRLILWKCAMMQPVRVPGVNTQGVYTPLSGTSVSEGSHALSVTDEQSTIFQLPSMIPDDKRSSAGASGTAGLPAKLTSVAWSEDESHVIVGTSANSVWELNVTSGMWSLVFEARNGVMAACSAHPSKNEAVTVSYDGYAAIWDLRGHICVRRAHLPSLSSTPAGAKPTCVEYHPNGENMLVGMSNGELLVVGTSDLRLMMKKTIKSHATHNSTHASAPNASPAETAAVVVSTSSPPVVQIKHDPTGKLLAVGAKDTFIYIYDTTNNYKRVHVCEGHSSSVTHLTWSIDGNVLQTNAGDGEVLFWSVSSTSGNTRQITDAFYVRDIQWIKWTCVFGWATPGIWPEDSTTITDIAAVAASGPKTQLAQHKPDPDDCSQKCGSGIGDDDLLAVANRNTLRLFRWPATKGSKGRAFHGHSSLISSVCFSFDDQFVLSAGGEDGALLQWRRNEQDGAGMAHSSSSCSVDKLQRRQKYRLNHGEGDTQADAEASPVSISPLPPSKSGNHRSGGRQPSPRQAMRHYREQRADDNGDSTFETEPTHASDNDRAISNYDGEDEQVRDPSTVPVHHPTELTVTSQCRAKHTFDAENSDELSFKEGDILRVLSKDSGEWWLGESCDGTRGVIPSNYVDEIHLVNDGDARVDTTAATQEEPDTIANWSPHDESEVALPLTTTLVNESDTDTALPLNDKPVGELEATASEDTEPSSSVT